MPTDPSGNEEPDLSVRRRKLLAASGVAIASVAGCTGSGDDDEADEPDGESQDADTETPELTPDEEDTATPEEEDSDDEEDVEPASFEVVDVDAPDEVSTGETWDYAITVENTGGEVGTYEELLELSIAGVDDYENVGYLTIEDVEPGETETWESDPVELDDPGTVQFRLGDTEWELNVTITQPDTQSFAGSGEEVRQDIEIEGGLTVIEASHNGESNFQVSLAGDGDFDDNFINVIGSFDGAQADLIDAGEYILDVNADGSWEVDIVQPRSGDGDDLPASFSGSGPDVVGPVVFGGSGVASGEHDGESNFQVRIYPMTGSFGEGVFNDIGAFDGETTYSFDGIGWIDVNADGNWSVELE